LKISNQKSAIENFFRLVIPSLLIIAALWFDWLPWLRGNDEWRWPLRAPLDLTRVGVPLIALACYVALATGWLRRFERASASRTNERTFLLFLTLAAPLLQLALAVGVSRAPLLEFFGPTVSVHNSGYFTTAVSTPDLNQLLARYPSIMSSLPIHAQSHPPGPIVAQWLSWQFFQSIGPAADAIALPLRTLQCHNPGIMALDNAQIASASLGMLLPLIGALAVWPLFAVGKRVAGSKAAALAAVLFPIMPLFAMWPAQWDQIYPLLLFTGLYFAHTGLTPRPSTTLRSAQGAASMSLWRIFLAGVPLSLATFFSVGNFVLMVIVGLYGVTWLALNRRLKSALHPSLPPSLRPSVSLSLRLAAAFALGCASIWLIYALIYGVNPLDVIATGSRLAFESTTGNRTYGTWLLGNPIDFAVFLGVPVVVLLVLNLAQVISFCPKSRSASLCRPEPNGIARSVPFYEPSREARTLLIATFGVLLLLIVSGLVRGEVGRLWLYFGPLFLLLAASAFTHHAPSRSIPVGRTTYHAPRTTLIALLSLQLFVMNTRWLVNDSYLDAPPERTANFTVSSPSMTTAHVFGQTIALRGYDARSGANQIDLTLHWQALAQPPHAYTVFAHAFDAVGQSVGQQDNMPLRNQLPTSCWQPGEVVIDPYTIALAAGARGPFTVEVGLYRLENGERLPLADGSGTSVRLIVP
jgi:hypothetical protein